MRRARLDLGPKLRKAQLLLLLALLAAGCGGGAEGVETESSIAVTGTELFNARVVGSNPGCVTCHSLNEGVTLVGPSLHGVGTTAASRVPGLSASEYLKQSIVAPDAFTVPGFGEGQMVGRWNDFLTAGQIDGLVEFLLGL